MAQTTLPATGTGLPVVGGWRRLFVALALSGAVGWLLGQGWQDGMQSILTRTVTVGLIATLVFSVLEHWPGRLPRWVARWVVQVVAVGVSVPISTLSIWILSTKPGAPPFWDDPERFEGWMMLTFFALLVAPWTALAALVRQKEALARHQALAFELERSELGRQALDARLQLLQAQVAPHFLFNTLANVQALVDTGSPRASAVLLSLIDYLRAAVPLLHDPAATIGRELRLVQAYLELMHMRMPDRLQYALDVDDSALPLRCPPTTLLTLVENAVRHGIDPSEEGGSIDIHIERRGGRCLIRVSDTGVGLRQTDQGLRTGLSTLRERLQLMFGGDAQLRITPRERGGVCAELEMPALAGTS
ncbi:MAG TPA: histidine kinase [Thermoanaerobaculia bacterium]|nr:histidine kinase [Thermoanaerobaculia bacterium]